MKGICRANDTITVTGASTERIRSDPWTDHQEIRISSANVDQIAAMASRIGPLIGQGVPITIQEPACT